MRIKKILKRISIAIIGVLCHILIADALYITAVFFGYFLYD